MQIPAARGALYVCSSSSRRLIRRSRAAVPFSRGMLAFNVSSTPIASVFAATAQRTLNEGHLNPSSVRYVLLSFSQRAFSTTAKPMSSLTPRRVRRTYRRAQMYKRLSPACFTSAASKRFKGLIMRLRYIPKRLLSRCKSIYGVIADKVRDVDASGALAAWRNQWQTKMQSKLWYLLAPALILALWPKTALQKEECPPVAAACIKDESDWLDEDSVEDLANDADEDLANDADEDLANDADEDLDNDASEGRDDFDASLELPFDSILKCMSGSPFSAAQLLRTSLLTHGVDFRLRDGLLALSMTWNPLNRDYIAATVDTSEKRLSYICLADIIEDLEAFDKGNYPYVYQKLLPTLRFLRALLATEAEKRLATEARNQVWEPMNLVGLAARLPLSTPGDDNPHQATSMLVWDLIVARTLCGAGKRMKLRLDTEKVYEGVVRFTDERASHLKWKPLSTSPALSLSACPDATSLLQAVTADNDDVQERLAVLLDVAGGEHVAAIPHRERDERAGGEERMRALLAISLVAQVCAYLIFTVRLPRQLSHAA